ncbi:MAG TPA: tripartite tricarboxylate transporter TctB family protein [Casimicrobiaceae bacterium]|jgi:putative tricarboxylic transport membrane protein
MKFNDAVFGAVLLVLGIAVLVHVPSFPQMAGQKVGPALFPGLIAAGLIACALILIVNGVKQRATQPWINTGEWTRSRQHIGAFFVTIGVVVAYIALADKVGFLIIGPLVLFALFIAYGVRPITAFAVAIVVTLVIHYAFYKLLRVPLPWGVLTPFAF